MKVLRKMMIFLLKNYKFDIKLFFLEIYKYLTRMKIFVIIFFIIFLSSENRFVNAQNSATERPKVGLILSGGGAKGLAHVGVLKVLEEAGIRPDYIGGTSMGSIVGGLYAIGYSVDSLEEIAKNTNWEYYLTDEISRRNLTLEEKEDFDRFFISFPVKDNKIKIPSGVISGQNIENLFNELCVPVYDTRDFNDFQIPFLCIATDIETGEEVLFNKGYLPKAMRASMSIPSIFNPIEIDGKLLVDGGVVNNFPVARVKDMGADILIGVDVGFQYYKKDELNSLFRIIEQSIFFYGEKLNEYNESLCDFLIEPELSEFNASSFNNADTIIARGEKIARTRFAEFKALADSLRSYDKNYGPKQKLPSVDSLKIMEIRIHGLQKVSGTLVNGKLQLEIFDKVTIDDITHAIERLYSSLYFDKIDYEIEKLPTGIRLIINVQEKKGGQFRAGMHYDTNYKSAILLNTTFRNILLDGSKLTANFALGENPYFKLSFFKNNGWRPGFGINFESNKFDVFLYENENKISSLAYAESKTQIFTQSIFWNSYAIGAGIELEASRLKPKIDPLLGIDKSFSSYLNYYGFLKMDTYDNFAFPKKGIKLNAQLKLVTEDDLPPIAFLVGQFSQAYKVSNKITYISDIYIGTVEGDTIPYQYNFYTGGLSPLLRNGILPFVGMEFMEKVSTNSMVLQGTFQFEPIPDFYFSMKASVGNLKDSFNDLFTADEILAGYGATISYDSFIGPLEFSLMKSANRSGMIGFVNIGFWF
jgi:NTE family protein